MGFSDLKFYFKIIEYFVRSNLNKPYIILSTFLFSPVLFFLEVRRRIFGKIISLCLMLILTILLAFCTSFLLKTRDMRRKNGYILIDKKSNLNIFSNNFLDFFPIISENSLDLYEYKLDEKEIKNKRILDIGGYIDTPLIFSKMGAREIIAFEPLYHKLLLKNLKINKIKNVIMKLYYVFSSECKQLKE